MSKRQDHFRYTIRRLSEGASNRQIAKELNVHHTTIAYWINNGFQTKSRSHTLNHDEALKLCQTHGADYAYILGAYLGDGTISETPKTFRMRIFNDMRYPDIIADQKRSLGRLFSQNKISEVNVKNSKCLIVSMYNSSLPKFFPQHGPGTKKTRDVSLKDWQWDIVKEEPECFIKGLIDSDGSCYIQTQTNRSGLKRYYKKYNFTNTSMDIVDLMKKTLEMLDINYLSVQKKVREENAPAIVITINTNQDVAKMDSLYDIAENKLRK